MREAERSVGETAYAANVGSVELIEHIASLDAQIVSATDAKVSAAALRRQKQKFLLELAHGEFPETNANPDLGLALGRLTAARTAVCAAEVATAEKRVAIWNGDRPTKLRTVVGYSSVAIVSFGAVLLSARSDSPRPALGAPKVAFIPPTESTGQRPEKSIPMPEQAPTTRPNPLPAKTGTGPFDWEKLAERTAPAVFGLRMGMTPDEMNRTIAAAGGTPLGETIPDGDAKRAGIERPLEPEIRLFQAETRNLTGLALPKGFDKVTFVFADGRLYKVTLYAKFFWSNMSPRNLAAGNIARNIPKDEAEMTAGRAAGNLNLADLPSLRLFVDTVDIRPEPGVTLKELRRTIDAAWQSDPRLAELAVVAAATYEKGGGVRSPQFYIARDTPGGGFTAVRKSEGLAVVFDATGWTLDVGEETDGIRKREFHCHWFWSDFVEKCGPDYLSKKSAASLVATYGDPQVATQIKPAPTENPATAGPGKAAGGLVAMLKSTDAKVRAEGALALSKLGPDAKAAVKDLTAALSDSDREVVTLAATALGGIGESGVPPLVSALQGSNEGVRDAARVGLLLSGKTAVPALVGLLGSTDKVTVSSAAAILGNIGKPAIPELLVALKHDNFQVRGFAALTIGRMGNDAKDALPAVRELRNDRHPSVRAAAEDTIRRVE